MIFGRVIIGVPGGVPEARPIKGYPGFLVSEAGDVFRLDVRASPPLRDVLPVPRNGYPRVRLLGACGRWHWRPVHVVVLETFVGPRPSSRHHGAHGPDRDRRNNRLSNLRWATPEENERDKREHGTAAKGRTKPKVSPALERRILRFKRHTRFSNTQIAKKVGVHRSTVARVARKFPT